MTLPGRRANDALAGSLAADEPAPPPLAGGTAVPAGAIAAPELDRRPSFDARPFDDHNYKWYNHHSSWSQATTPRAQRGAPRVAAGTSYRKEQAMRVERQGRAVDRAALTKVDDAKLAAVLGGLKAERVQGSDPAGTVGT